VVRALLTLGGLAALDFGLDPFRKASGWTGEAINGGEPVRAPPPKVIAVVTALLDSTGQPTEKSEVQASSPFQLHVRFHLPPGERPPRHVFMKVYHDKPGGKRTIMQTAIANVKRIDDQQYEAVIKANPVVVPGDFRAVVTTADDRLPAVLAERRISFLR